MAFSILALLALAIFLVSLHILKRYGLQLSLRIVLSLLLGIGYGLLLRYIPENQIWFFIKNILHFMGDGYLKLLQMLVVPLIITSIIHAILTLGSTEDSTVKKLSFLTCGMLLGMTAIASLIGILVGRWFNVGQGMSLLNAVATPKHVYTGITDTLLAMLPDNPVAIMAQNNTVAIVIFAVLVGMAVRLLDNTQQDKVETFKKLMAALFVVVKKLAVIVLGLTPYGVFGLMSLLLLDQGFNLLMGVLNFIAAMYVAIAFVLVMHLLILAMVGYSPIKYFKNAYVPLFVAFTTRSSFATLPVTEETLRDKFKTSQITATFVPSIGATIGMNACAGVFPAMLVVMALAILHQPITLQLVITVMSINAIASLGISGIPGTAYIAATVTLLSLNLPYAVIALVQGVDPIIDMGRTATNISGVLTTALVTDSVIQKE